MTPTSDARCESFSGCWRCSPKRLHLHRSCSDAEIRSHSNRAAPTLRRFPFGRPKPRKMEAMPLDMPAPSETIETVRKMCERSIVVQLKDPDSARFGSPLRGGLRRTRGGHGAARHLFFRQRTDSYGGYTGAKSWTCSLHPTEAVVVWTGSGG